MANKILFRLAATLLCVSLVGCGVKKAPDVPAKGGKESLRAQVEQSRSEAEAKYAKSMDGLEQSKQSGKIDEATYAQQKELMTAAHTKETELIDRFEEEFDNVLDKKSGAGKDEENPEGS